MRGVLPLLLLVACGPADLLTDDSDTDVVDVHTWVEGQLDRGVGTFVVQVTFDEGLDVDLPEPQVPGLRFTEVGPPDEERLGGSVVTTRRYRFAGEAGSYELPALTVSATVGDGAVQDASEPIWVDVGGDNAPLDGFAGTTDREPVVGLSSAFIVGAACAGLGALGVIGGVLLAFVGFSRRSARNVPPEAPDVVALRRWQAVRGDPNLSDHDKAVALAVIFRDYAEAVLSFPATAATTSEILARLGRMPHLPDGNVGRAQRILRATDRIKFAEGAARDTLFEELDDALRTFVASTRPRSWEST